MKDGPPYAIDSMSLYQLVADPDFFNRVPALFFMRDQAQAVVARIVDGLLGKRKSNCAGCGDVRKQMEPVASTFVTVIRQLADSAPQLLEPLADYVAERRGYRPRPIIVYYKKAGGTEAVRF